MVEVPTIRTARLDLVPMQHAHFEENAAMFADPEVARFLGGKPLSRHEAWRAFAAVVGHWQLRGYGMWAVEERATGAFVGRVGVHYPETWPAIEIGWALAPRFWGRGYATEAARASVDYAWARVRPARLVSLIAPLNLRSAAVAARLGARPMETIELLGGDVVVHEHPRPAAIG